MAQRGTVWQVRFGGVWVANIRVIKALQILRQEVPDYFNDAILSDCPSDLGLPAKYRKMCGMESTTFEFSSEFCQRCWDAALEDKD